MGRRNRLLVFVGALVVAGAAAWLIHGGVVDGVQAQTANSNGASAPKTPWGDPDLQGIWSPGYYLTPLERPNK